VTATRIGFFVVMEISRECYATGDLPKEPPFATRGPA
jgi:hypothetical protein